MKLNLRFLKLMLLLFILPLQMLAAADIEHHHFCHRLRAYD